MKGYRENITLCIETSKMMKQWMLCCSFVFDCFTCRIQIFFNGGQISYKAKAKRCFTELILYFILIKIFIFFTFVICLCLYKYIGFLGYGSQFINHTLQISGLFAHYCESSFPSKFVISQYCYNSCATFGSLSMSCEVYKRIYKFSSLINPFQFVIPFNNKILTLISMRTYVSQ